MNLNHNDIKLTFTGERMIPDQNQKMALYYEHLSRYLLSLQLTKDKTLLDIASGAGYGSYILATNGKAKQVYGVDLSEEAVNYACSKYKTNNLSFAVDDAQILSTIVSASIDLTLAFEVLEHLEKPIKMLKQIKRVLKVNGICLISTPNKFTYQVSNPFHKKEYNPQQFYQILRKSFKYVFFYYQSFAIAETIKPDMKTNFNFEDNFLYIPQDLYAEPIDLNNAQYIIALCSDKKLPILRTLSMTASKVDNFDFSRGIELCDLEKQIEELKKSKELLNTVQSSKFYKLWRKYCEIKEYVFDRN